MIDSKVIYNAYNECDLSNYWQETPYESYYQIGAKSKGVVGEHIIKCYLQDKGFSVIPRISPGHDMIINNIKAEVKFSLASKRNYCNEYTFNHIGVLKDWERIIFCGINGDLQEQVVWFSKEDMIGIVGDNRYFSRQEGDDDFFSMGGRSKNLLCHSLAKSMEDW